METLNEGFLFMKQIPSTSPTNGYSNARPDPKEQNTGTGNTCEFVNIAEVDS